MPGRAQRNLIRALLFFGLCGVAAVALSWASSFDRPVEMVPPNIDVRPGLTEPQHWFANVKASCNAVEVTTTMRLNPAPDTREGTMYEAACWALAGNIDEARRLILELPEESRWEAAGIVFEAGHPAADAGDELAAGSLMELVVEFWPNHHMALYHAGSARYQRGEYAEAEPYLRDFLRYYEPKDGWRRNAETMLEQVAGVEG